MPQCLLKWIFLTGVFIVSLVYSPGMLAATTNSDEQNQQTFLAALSQLQQGHQQAFLLLSQHLQHYPLYPYLIYSDLILHLDNESPLQLNNFLETYQNTPLSAHLRNAWLTLLASQHEWHLFLMVYKPTSNVTLECDNREALWETGHYAQAVNNINVLLNKNNNTNLPKACMTVFGHAVTQGNIAQSLLWERIQFAMNAHNTALAQQLAVLLPRAQQKIFLVWQKVNKKPELILSLKLPDEIMLTGLSRLANQNPRGAIESWKKIMPLYSSTMNNQAIKIIALALARAHDPIANNWLLSIPVQETDNVVREWRIRTALLAQNWPVVQASINLLNLSDKNSPEWRYWMARALAGQHDTVQADEIYHTLALKSNLYGQLASLQINEKPLTSVNQLSINAAQLNAIASIPAIQRAYELYQLHWLPEAAQEWDFAIAHLPSADYLAAAELAIRWGWYQRAISTVNLMNNGTYTALRFPLAYRDDIIKVAARQNLNPAWVFALVRQESLFMPDIKSSAGALGLMQLMPNTAALLAGRLHMFFQHSFLLNPETNLYLGSIYLKKMLVFFNGNIVLATAAYNAGPGNIKKWLPSNTIPADIWIDTIPFHETRGYVKNIMGSMTFYEKELGLPDTLHQRIKENEI